MHGQRSSRRALELQLHLRKYRDSWQLQYSQCKTTSAVNAHDTYRLLHAPLVTAHVLDIDAAAAVLIKDIIEVIDSVQREHVRYRHTRSMKRTDHRTQVKAALPRHSQQTKKTSEIRTGVHGRSNIEGRPPSLKRPFQEAICEDCNVVPVEGLLLN